MKLICEELRLEDLEDTGSKSDPQDPQLNIKIGKTTKSTERYIE